MKKSRGFTLMEIITAVGLSALVLSGLGAIFAGTITLWSRVQNSTSILKEGRLAMQWLARDIMEGNITKAGTDYIVLDKIDYSLSGKNLLRNKDLVAENIKSLKFAYYNKEGKEEKDIKNIKFVSIELTAEENGHKLTLRNGAGLRNYSE